MNDMNKKKRGYINLKEVIFAGRSFCKLRQFLAISKNMFPAKFPSKTNPRKLILTKNTK